MRLNRTSEWKVISFEFLGNFHCSFFSISIYHGPQSYTHVNSYGCLNWTRASVFNFEHFDILCAWIDNPSENLWPFEFHQSFCCSFSSVWIYHGSQSYNRVKSYNRLNLRRAFVFNFDFRDILCAWIGHLSEKLWPFEFLRSFRCSFSSISIYHGPQSYNRVKIYSRSNLLRAFVLNFERLDILCTWIGHPNEKLWPFEYLESCRCSFTSVLIHHGPHTYTHVNSYGRLNRTRASVFNFERFDILCAWIENPSENLWPFEFLDSFRCSF